MKNAEASNITKIIAAVIIGVMLIFMIGIVANGWQNDLNGENSGEVDDSNDNADNLNGDTDENEGTADNITVEKEPEIPKFMSYLTGLKITEDMDGILPYAILIEPGAPIYGISGSELTIEIPTENGNTRFVVYRNDISNLGKIGAITKTRNYISQTVKFFGGIQVAYGNDDIVSYSSIPSTLHIDLSKNSDYVYKENGKNIYTDRENLETLVKSEGIDLLSYKNQNMPFEFVEYYETVSGNASAETVLIPYTDTNSTYLKYDAASKTYHLYKGERAKVDMLDGKTALYKNVFVLFSNMITYELSSGTETVVDTASGGSGYYITDGTLTELRWSVDKNGNLTFKDLNENKLTVNRGNSYIGYYKASDLSSVIFD